MQYGGTQSDRKGNRRTSSRLMREHAQSKVIRLKECGKEISGEELSRRNIWHRPKAESDVAIGGGSDKAYGRRVINVDSGGAERTGRPKGRPKGTARGRRRPPGSRGTQHPPTELGATGGARSGEGVGESPNTKKFELENRSSAVERNSHGRH